MICHLVQQILQSPEFGALSTKFKPIAALVQQITDLFHMISIVYTIVWILQSHHHDFSSVSYHMILSQAPAGLLPKAVSLYMGAIRTSRQPIKHVTHVGPTFSRRISRDNPCHDSRDSVQFTNSTNLEINSHSGCPLFGQHPVSRAFHGIELCFKRTKRKNSACSIHFFCGVDQHNLAKIDWESLQKPSTVECRPDPGLSAYPIGSSPEGITFKTCMGANIPPT